jgi:hypothetical protein
MAKLLVDVDAKMLRAVAHHIEVSVSASDVERRAAVVSRLGHVCAEFICEESHQSEVTLATSQEERSGTKIISMVRVQFAPELVRQKLRN